MREDMAGVIASVATSSVGASALPPPEPAAIWMTLGPGTVVPEVASEPVSSLAPHALNVKATAAANGARRRVRRRERCGCEETVMWVGRSEGGSGSTTGDSAARGSSTDYVSLRTVRR